MAWFKKESQPSEIKLAPKPSEAASPNEVQPHGDIKSKEKPKKPTFEFKDSDSAEEYLEWKSAVPIEFRRLVESNLKNAELAPSKTGLPLTDQFLNKFTEAIKAKDIPDTADVDNKVANLLKPMTRVETKGGYLNVFEALANPDVSWNLKRKIYDTQVKTALEWLANRDLTELAKQAQKQKEPTEPSGESTEPGEKGQPGKGEDSDVPPPDEKVAPGGDMGERKEGEPAKALFSVSPFYGGYYKQLRFNKLDPNTLEWQKPENSFSESTIETLNALSSRVIFGKVHGRAPLSIPLPYDWTIDSESLTTDAPEGNAEILRNQDGLWYLKIDADGIFKYQVRASRKQRLSEEAEPSQAKIVGNLPPELKSQLDELNKKRFPKLKLKREIVKLVRNRLKYVTSDEINNHYKQNPQDIFGRIWQRKEANCYWANMLGARVLAEVDNQWGYIGGFSVREKDDQGNAILYSGNGHSWLEVWDEASQRTIRLDATPAGDPNVDQEQQEKELDGETGEGDYGEQDELASESDVQKQIKDLKKKEGGSSSKKKDKPGYDLMEQSFAELAECTPEQAKEFLKALERVRQIKDQNGEPITDLMKEEWRKIIEERKIESLDYRGPVRMDEGSRLEDPVSARIDIKAKELNPTGFERDELVEKTENDFGGLDIYFSFDLSGSMNQPDGASGRIKADVQCDVGLLFADSLMQLSYMTRQHGEQSDLLPIKIMVTLASDTGDVKLHLTDKWGPKEQWVFYSALTQLARGDTPTHKTLEKIEVDFDKELAELKNKRIPQEKMPIQYTTEISDGVPDDFNETEGLHQKLKAKGMAIRSYTIGGQSASADAAEPLETFSQLPQILVRDIIEQFRKLRPRKIKP